jgi:endonuclease/exonuclease/phosphatase family metal-dependent hydrolase
LTLVLAFTAACATGKSFTDPAGPRYDGSFAPAGGGAPCGGQDRSFTVVTFNVEHGREVGGAIALLKAHDRSRAADALLLQEMDTAGVARVAELLALHYVFFPSGIHPQSGREFGTAVLSRWPLEEARKLVLPYGAYLFFARRAVTVATVVCGGFRIRLYSAHLSSPPALMDDRRQEQVRLIAEDAAGAGPAIVGGDFNSSRVTKAFERAGFSIPTRDLPGTSRGLGRWFKFDHVFVRGLAAAPGAAAGVIEPGGVSDHRAVWVRLLLPPS